ncbi:inter-alpha-trypsin inhibitor heavy chain H6-like [Heptranchias perlo]|uniref:inter-alpha-trypsin inhibitor heavy chain H6-like n=1 Tax=Heptranchias perlo TaxID=212740 RepID=UPI0035599A5D
MTGLARLATALALCAAVLAPPGKAATGEARRRLGRRRLGRDSETAGELVITDLLIRSTVVSRYALTTVHSVVHNPASEAREAVFNMDLPGAAFISNFTLTVKEKVYPAEVKEKEKAERVYDAARRRGQTAAHVATRGRETEKFRVAVNVEARGRVAFTLTYEELLQRRLGTYELALSLRPKQIVRNLTVEVTISERTGIEYVKVLPLRTSNLLNNKLKGPQDVPESTAIERTPTCARVKFSPTPEQQASFSSQGVLGDFVVQYDVRLTDLIGDVQTYNGYFVHYFAPRSLPVVAKNVIFVIDVSSSMIGTKIRQTKEAMITILDDLRTDDHFNIITFSDVIQVWKPNQSIQATPENVQRAKNHVNKMVAEGWTDINAALLAAAKVLSGDAPSGGHGAGGTSKVPLVIFLTDGEPTSGVTSSSAIISNAKEAMQESLFLFCLGFGDDVDFPLLRRLSLDNRGVARRIYEDADASLQLKGFYDEVASPLLFDVELSYLDNRVEAVTRSLFPAFFNGSELIVAGRLTAGEGQALRVRLEARGSGRALELENEILLNRTEPALGCPRELGGVGGFVQRLWAYHTIKELLQARLKMDEEDARRLLTEKATALALKYNFVTPLTSMVVVKPPEDGGTNPAAVASPTAPAATGRSLSTPGVPSPSAKSPALPSERPPGEGASPPAAGPRLRAGTGVPAAPGRPTTGPRDGKGGAAAPGTAMTFVRGISATHGPMLHSGELLLQEMLVSDNFETIMDIDTDYEDEVADLDFFDSGLQGVGLGDTALPYVFSVDGDPHFVVKVPDSNETICFTIDGRAEDTLRLVADPVSGVTVDGHLMGAPANPEHQERSRTFLDLISVRVRRPETRGGGYTVRVSRENVTLEGEHHLSIPWDPPSVTSRPGLRLSVSRSAGVSVSIGADIRLLVLLHRYAHPTPLQLEHLGFYVVRGEGLSRQARGLLGQFQHADIHIRRREECRIGKTGQGPNLAELRCKGQKVGVSLATKTLKDSSAAAHAALCWLVRREDVERLIDGTYVDYVVPPRPLGA